VLSFAIAKFLALRSLMLSLYYSTSYLNCNSRAFNCMVYYKKVSIEQEIGFKLLFHRIKEVRCYSFAYLDTARNDFSLMLEALLLNFNYPFLKVLSIIILSQYPLSITYSLIINV
jgi:hypothetical protein